MTKCAQLPLPDTGSQRSWIENSMMRMRAKKKLGSACPNTAMPSASRSIQLLANTAARTPSGIDTASANRIENSPSHRVVGSFSMTRQMTTVLK